MAERKATLKATGQRVLNPARAKTLAREKKMTIDEWERFWPHVEERHHQFYFDMMQSLGLRAHEGLDLRLTDFDFTNGFVTIRTLKRKDGHVMELPVRPDILGHMKDWQHLDKPLRVFVYTYDQMLRSFKQTAAKAGLNPRLGLHSLRHLCGTRLYMARASNEEIGYFLRHKPRSMQERYVEIPLDRLVELAKLMWEKQTGIWKGDHRV